MPVVRLRDLPFKFPDDSDVILIESEGNLYKSFVGELRPSYPVAPPLDLDGVTDPVYLSPGYAVYKRFAGDSAIDLPISIADEAVYRMFFFFSQPAAGSVPNTSALMRLLPNYVELPSGYSYSYRTVNTNGSGTADGLVLGLGYCFFNATIYAKPNMAASVSHAGFYTSSFSAGFFASRLLQTSLVWSVFGRLILPGEMSGVVYVRREA